jgi:rubrerythrin
VSEVIAWLKENVPGAPPALAELLERAVADQPDPGLTGVAETLAQGARKLYQEAFAGTGGREDAIVLLAADALLTHAFEAQARSNPEELARFAERWGAGGEIGRLAESVETGSEASEAVRVPGALETLRLSEKRQALFYRGLSALAEAADDAGLTQRFQDLHADEQHHLSRLTARILELGGRPVSLNDIPAPVLSLEGWEEVVRDCENEEILLYRALRDGLDEVTRALVDDILSVEEHHRSELGGKWTLA